MKNALRGYAVVVTTNNLSAIFFYPLYGVNNLYHFYGLSPKVWVSALLALQLVLAASCPLV